MVIEGTVITLGNLLIKRIYDQAQEGDGYRILVDRIWPRGKSKDEVKLDDWAKDMAPSTETRKAFNHEPAKMESFREDYVKELNSNPAAAEFLKLVSEKTGEGNVTLLYGAKSEIYNQAAVLRDWIIDRFQAKNRAGD